jgi:tRNA(Ile)-lysidine synthetase-like protein
MCPARLHGKSRKLSDLFIDAKVPRDVRRLAQVLIRTSDGTIVWAEHVGIAFGESPDLEPVPV